MSKYAETQLPLLIAVVKNIATWRESGFKGGIDGVEAYAADTLAELGITGQVKVEQKSKK